MRSLHSRLSRPASHVSALLSLSRACLATAAVVAAACGDDSAIVGGVCAQGYMDCDNHCIPVSSDPGNCGACGNVCASGECLAGVCAGVGKDAASPRDAREREASASRDARAHDGTVPDAASGGDAGHADVVATDAGHAVSDAAAHHDAALPDGHAAEASAQDARVADARAGDAHADAAGADAARADAASTDAAAARDAAPQCTPPFTTASSCGACGVACPTGQICAPPSADAGPDAGSYGCVDECTLPLVACDGTCLDVTGDPMNCGACGRVCMSGICVTGVCAGSTPGDIVVIGHDYAAASVRVSEAELLSNAVFLPPSNPLRVLSFEQYADATQVANVKGVLKQAALTLGRTVDVTPATDYTLVPASLTASDYDVLLVYDQSKAPSGTLALVGAAWQSPVTDFLIAGGDVVVLDGASGAHPQMTALLSGANLLQTTAETPIASGTQLLVVASGDAVGNSVVSPYAAQTDTVSFVTSEPNGASVTYVVDALGDGGLVPVVVHKTVAAP